MNGRGGQSGSGGAGGSGFGALDGGGNGGNGGLGGACAGDRYDGEPVPLDILLMLDRSGSMKDGGKWGAVTTSVNNFLGNVTGDGVAVGISFFPTDWATQPNFPAPCTLGGCGAYACVPIFNQCHVAAGKDSCVSVDYTQPVVDFALLPGVASQIQSAMSAQSPNGDTTTIEPALKGALDYATAYAQQRLDHQVVVVLATDGEPTGCASNSISGAGAYADAANKANPSVKTFVIGIGSELAALNSIAVSGGTGMAYIVSSGNAGQGFLDAMNEIRGAAICKYKVPTPPEGEPNPDLVNVGITPPGETQSVIPRVSGPGACVGQPGWYYDNPSAPTQIELCPASCDIVEYGENIVVDVVIGCDTIIR